MTGVAEATTAVSAISQVSSGAGTVGAIVAGAIIVFLAARPLLSKLNLGTKMDSAQIDAIDRLGRLLNEEREARKLAEERADRFAQERNEAVQKIGRLEGEIHALRAEVAGLRADMERRHAPPQA